MKNSLNKKNNLFYLSILSAFGILGANITTAHAEALFLDDVYTSLGKCANDKKDSCHIVNSGLIGPNPGDSSTQKVNLKLQHSSSSLNGLSANKYGLIGQNPDLAGKNYTQFQNYEFDISNAISEKNTSNELYFSNVDSLQSTKFVFEDKSQSKKDLGLHFITKQANVPIKLTSVDYTIEGDSNSNLTIYADSVQVDRLITNAQNTKFELGFVSSWPDSNDSTLSFKNLDIGKNLTIETTYLDFKLQEPISFAQNNNVTDNITFKFNANNSAKDTTFSFDKSPVQSNYKGTLNFTETSLKDYDGHLPNSIYYVNINFKDPLHTKEVNVHQEGRMIMKFNTTSWDTYTGNLNFTSNQIANSNGQINNPSSIWNVGYINFVNDSNSLTNKLGGSNSNITLAGKFAFNDASLKDEGFKKLNGDLIKDENAYEFTKGADIKLIDANGANVKYSKGAYFLFDTKDDQKTFVDINTGAQYFIGKGTNIKGDLKNKYTILGSFTTTSESKDGAYGTGDLSLSTKIVGVDTGEDGYLLKANGQNSNINTPTNPIGFGKDDLSLCKAYDYKCGIYGVGNLTVDGRIYLAGDNSYTGKTIINKDSALFIKDQLAIDKTSGIEFNENSSFGVIGKAKAEFENKKFNIHADNVTIGDSTDTNAGTFTLDKGSILSFNNQEQKDIQSNIINTNLSVIGDSSISLNSSDLQAQADAPLGRNSVKLSSNAVLSIGSKDSNGNLRLGRGSISVDQGGTLNINEKSTIYVDAHKDGEYEHGQGAFDDANIKLNGGTINLTLSDDNKVVTTHLVQEGHKHHLLAGNNENQDFYNAGNINIKIDANSSIVKDEIVSKLDESVAHKLTTSGVSIKELIEALNKVGADDDSLDTFGDILDHTLNNEQALQSFKFNVDKTGIYLASEKIKKVKDFLPDTDISDQADEVVDVVVDKDTTQDQIDDKKENAGDFDIIDSVIDYANDSPSVDKKISASAVLDVTSQLAAFSGVQTIAFNSADTNSRLVLNHLDNYDEGLWADLMYYKGNNSGLSTNKSYSNDLDIDLYGIVVGSTIFKADKYNLGLALSVVDGDATNSVGASDRISVKNDIRKYLGTFYGQYAITNTLKLEGTILYQYGKNDLDVTLPEQIAANMANPKLSANINSQTMMSKLVLVKDFNIDKFTISPYVGVGYTQLHTSSYTVKAGNTNAWYRDSSDQNIYSIPAGVNFNYQNQLNDYLVSTYAKVFAQPNFGDINFENELSGEFVSTKSTTSPDVISKFTYGASLGFMVNVLDNLNTSFEYTYVGSKDSDDHLLNAKVSYRF